MFGIIYIYGNNIPCGLTGPFSSAEEAREWLLGRGWVMEIHDLPTYDDDEGRHYYVYPTGDYPDCYIRRMQPKPT